MDLHNLLNSQKEEAGLSFDELQTLLEKRDVQASFERIQSATVFTYPEDKQVAFQYFDVFIQLILFILHNDQSQYTSSIITNSLRQCINGFIKDNGVSWLSEFPCHFSPAAWASLNANNKILLYLYGMVLSIMNEPTVDWMRGFLSFIHSESLPIITHVWLNVCCELNDVVTAFNPKEMYLQTLDTALVHKRINPALVREMLEILKTTNTDFIAKQINQELGNALARRPFTRDDFVVGFITLESSCQSGHYLCLNEIFQDNVKLESISPNPLLNDELTSTVPPDIYAQTEAVRRGTLFWIKHTSAMKPNVFKMHLKNLIQKHYPTDRKTILDLVLVNWALRDRFEGHLDFIVGIFISQLRTTYYNRRTSPYYAFVQMFNIPDERSHDFSYLQMKSGAHIDLSQFSNCSDVKLMEGCIAMLKKLTTDGSDLKRVEEWMFDSLQSASFDVIKRYTKWLCDELDQKRPVSEPFKVLLKSCIAQYAHIVPIVLDAASEYSLSWLLKENPTHAAILLHYFDDGPQVSRDIVVTRFFTTKTKACVDLLLGYLRSHMSGTDPKLPRSRAWFENHFLKVILLLVGQDQSGKSVASQLFRQLFKTRDDFEWYFSTPLISTPPIQFKSLALANKHDIYSVKNTGLATMFQELIRLKDSKVKQRIVNVWNELWIQDNDKFTVPVSWVLHCAGLCDKAPVIVRQMIKQFVKIGLNQRQEQDIMRPAPERKFLDRMMDLVLLSDTSDPDSLFEIVLHEICDLESSFEEINTGIINLMIDLSAELDLEIRVHHQNALSTPRPHTNKITKRRGKKNAMTGLKLGELMRKHEEELETYLNEKKETISSSVKALTILVQRVISFLLRLLNNSSPLVTIHSPALLKILSIRQEIQQQLVNIPLYYVSLGKLAKLITQPEHLYEDNQTAIELSIDYLKKQDDQSVYESCHKIVTHFSGNTEFD